MKIRDLDSETMKSSRIQVEQLKRRINFYCCSPLILCYKVSDHILNIHKGNSWRSLELTFSFRFPYSLSFKRFQTFSVCWQGFDTWKKAFSNSLSASPIRSDSNWDRPGWARWPFLSICWSLRSLSILLFSFAKKISLKRIIFFDNYQSKFI